MGLKNLIELLNQLRCELLLGQIVWTLYYHGDDAVVRHFAELTLFECLSRHLIERFCAKKTGWFLDGLIRRFFST